MDRAQMLMRKSVAVTARVTMQGKKPFIVKGRELNNGELWLPESGTFYLKNQWSKI